MVVAFKRRLCRTGDGRAGPILFTKRLKRGAWETVHLTGGAVAQLETNDGVAEVSVKSEKPDADAATPAAVAPGAAPSEKWGRLARESAHALLRRALQAAGASAEESTRWAVGTEDAFWRNAATVGADTEHEKAASLRLYRAEIRRIGAALKVPAVAVDMLSRLRTGELDPACIATLPPEELLPEAKRQRLLALRSGPPEEDGRVQLPYLDVMALCRECGKAGSVRYGYVATSKEGFAKAEIWGSRENDDRRERCQARCDDCLAVWMFDP